MLEVGAAIVDGVAVAVHLVKRIGWRIVRDIIVIFKVINILVRIVKHTVLGIVEVGQYKAVCLLNVEHNVGPLLRSSGMHLARTAVVGVLIAQFHNVIVEAVVVGNLVLHGAVGKRCEHRFAVLLHKCRLVGVGKVYLQHVHHQLLHL